MDVETFIKDVKSADWYDNQLVHLEKISGRDPVVGQVDRLLSDGTAAALERIGIQSFFYHQAEAINALQNGKNVVISTSTSSGKSLCYNVPVVEALSSDKSKKALYLFPTKALSQDQSRGLERMTALHSNLRHDIFDGDTPAADRTEIRRRSRIVITNPDMLHLGILPNHKSWHSFFRGLKYVVVDEAHIYRGVFGSNFSNIIRRLLRICASLGSVPQFIFSSATIANPREHAENLTGLEFEVIELDGSPSSDKHFIFWNPPALDSAIGSRRSTNWEAAKLTTQLLKNQIRSMTFVRGRRQAELVHLYVRENLFRIDPSKVEKLAPYKGSYLPEDRRLIEKALFDGNLLGLITTNAMELGVDVGDLDATILTGFPGTIVSTWQQSGRGGRGPNDSMSVLVASDDPLDQYLMNHPEAFFKKTFEHARTSPNNPYIQKPHLICAAYELPLTMSDTKFFGPDMLWNVDELVKEGQLNVKQSYWHISPEVSYPAEKINIRSVGQRIYTLVDEVSGAIIETIDEIGAFSQMYPGGTYLHQGRSLLVTDLDTESLTAYCIEADLPYYTEVRDFTQTRIINEYRCRGASNTTVHIGEVNVSTQVLGFRRKHKFTEMVLGDEHVSLPMLNYDTVSLWLDVPPKALDYIKSYKLDLAGGLHAIEHASIGILPLFAMCDRSDIGGISTPIHPDTGRPQVFIHDGHIGGVGISELGYERAEELIMTTLEVVTECSCGEGCPGCVQSAKCGNNNEPLDKNVARIILKEMLNDGSING